MLLRCGQRGYFSDVCCVDRVLLWRALCGRVLLWLALCGRVLLWRMLLRCGRVLLWRMLLRFGCFSAALVVLGFLCPKKMFHRFKKMNSRSDLGPYLRGFPASPA